MTLRVELIMAGFWLPLLARTVARVTGVTDYNIVQNNGEWGYGLCICASQSQRLLTTGARAAQVVPHVHFHIIPRPGTMPEIKNKSWTMFGRGQRDDLDDEEGAQMAGEMRKVLRQEIEKLAKSNLKL
jgi:diadenosine tetraphosphate (Ap4A) HIT family hydrolase